MAPFTKEYPAEWRPTLFGGSLPPLADGHRRIWLHLFEDQKRLAEFVEARDGRGKDFDDPWEPGAYTDDVDDIWCSEYAPWRNRLGIGTDKVVWHELRHIYLNGPDEDGVKNDNDEHHHFLKCGAFGLCVGANHGIRLVDAHMGGVPKGLAKSLLSIARTGYLDAQGVRHGFIDVLEAEILEDHA